MTQSYVVVNPYQIQMKLERPTSITIIAILGFLSIFFELLNPDPVSIVIGILYVISAFGLWNMKKWGAYLAIAAEILGILAFNATPMPFGVSQGVAALARFLGVLFSLIPIYFLRKHLPQMT